MGIKWPHGCSQSKAPFKFHTVFLSFPPYVALDPANPPHVIMSWTCMYWMYMCVGGCVRAHTWRWFRNCFPASKDLYVALTQNTGLLSNNSLGAGKQQSDLSSDSSVTSLQPYLSSVCIPYCFYMSVNVTANPKVIRKWPHFLRRPDSHGLFFYRRRLRSIEKSWEQFGCMFCA